MAIIDRILRRRPFETPPVIVSEPVAPPIVIHTSPKTVAFPGRDVLICGNPSDRYFQHIESHAGDTAFLQQVLAEKIGPDATILDVGANIGVTTSLLASHSPNGRVISFEPSPVAYVFLQETIAANRVSHVTAINAAVGDVEGVLPFMDNEISTTASHLNLDPTLGEETATMVEVHALDQILPKLRVTKVDLIKIDVEGHERAVIDGALNTIRTMRPLVFMEFNSFTLQAYGNQNPRSFLEYLQTLFSDIQYSNRSEIVSIQSKHDMVGFLHANLVEHSSVTDILCIP